MNYLKAPLRFRLAALFIFFLALPARAWDDTGHKVIAYIAWQQMTPAARAAVIDVLRFAPPRSSLLSLYPPVRQPSRDMIYFMRASVWPDIVRDRDFPERLERYHRGPWHYTNYFWEEGPEGAVERTDLHPEEFNVVERMGYLEGVASNDFYARAQRAIAIAWLEHLVGDIHQPLHTSARVTASEPEGDRGGNLFGLGERNNLHGYWDRLISAAYARGEAESEASYLSRVGRSIMDAHPASEFEAAIEDMSPESWARHGFEIATTEVYEGLERGQTPSNEYFSRASEIAERSAALAGYRLGRLMNQIFG